MRRDVLAYCLGSALPLCVVVGSDGPLALELTVGLLLVVLTAPCLLWAYWGEQRPAEPAVHAREAGLQGWHSRPSSVARPNATS
jgi:hypothetical protein